jgi:FecR-like protein
MLSRITLFLSLSSLATLAALGLATPVQAQDAQAAAWRVSKSSGNVWLMTTGAQPASLGAQVQLKPGDAIRTGNNGRVLLERGKESILIAPNSALTIPATQIDPASTTILQQSGSIELRVEKRNVRNFEVETPFLVAAVKGTEFTVTVNKKDASVQVSGGSVEVTDFKTGDHALVAPGQAAKVAGQGPGGLSLSGTGTFSPIEHGAPRPSPVQPLTVPRNGLSPPHDAPAWQHVRAHGGPVGLFADAGGGQHGIVQGAGGTVHIGSPLGELKLDIHKVTHGLARGEANGATTAGSKQSIWSNGDLVPGNGVAKNYNQGNNGSAGGAASAGGIANGLANGGVNGLLNGNGNVNANGIGAGNTNGNGLKNGHNKI